MSENVKIPLALLNRAIYLLESINPDILGPSTRWDYDAVLSELVIKKQTLDLRQSYAKIVCAKDDAERFNARMQYLKEKSNILG